MEWGKRLESLVLEAYAERTGRQVIPWPQTRLAVRSDYGWMRCTPDATQMDPALGEGLVEIKTANVWTDEAWSGETMPPVPVVQLQHNLAVTGREYGTIVCLVGGQHLVWRDYRRHDGFITQLIEREQEFWKLVETLTPPPPDWTADCRRVLATMFPPEEVEEPIPLDGEAESLDKQLTQVMAELRRHNAEISELEKQKKEIENKLIALMRGKSKAVLPSTGVMYQYAMRKQKGYMVADKEYPVFTRKEPKRASKE